MTDQPTDRVCVYESVSNIKRLQYVFGSGSTALPCPTSV